MKVLQNIFCGFLLAGIVFMAVAVIHLGTKNDADRSSYEEVIPAQISQPDEQTKMFTFILEDLVVDKNYLVFMSNHEEITAISGGHTYELKKTNSIFGHTTGTVINFIPVPNGTRRIVVKCKDVYKGITQQDYRFYYGDGLHIMKYLLRESLMAEIFSLADICLGVAMVIYWLMARTRINKKKILLNLGLFTLLMGFWTLNETNTFKLYVLDGLQGSFIAFNMLMLAIIPYCLFINEFFEIRKKFVVKSIVIGALVNYVVLTLLQILNIVDYKQSAIITHSLMAVAVIYQLYALCYGYKHYGFDYKMKMNLIGTVFLASVVVLDLVSYYQAVLLTNETGRISLLIYTFTLGMAAVKETNELLDENRKAEVYKELAFMDTLTGLLNRNAYNDYLTNHKVKENNMIISFDLNNLKLCNDTLGHQAGDSYITNAAAIIKKVFSEYGKCYRIGGDEFCVVIEDAGKIPIKEHIEKMQYEQKAFCKENHIDYMNIAVGYAIYDPERDRNLEDARNRSDEMMYLTKAKMKSTVI